MLHLTKFLKKYDWVIENPKHNLLFDLLAPLVNDSEDPETISASTRPLNLFQDSFLFCLCVFICSCESLCALVCIVLQRPEKWLGSKGAGVTSVCVLSNINPWAKFRASGKKSVFFFWLVRQLLNPEDRIFDFHLVLLITTICAIWVDSQRF